MSFYSVIIEGTTLQGFAAEDVRPRLATLTKQSDEVAAGLLSGQPKTVKSGVDQATALRYVGALREIGVACHSEAETLAIDLPEPVPKVETAIANEPSVKRQTAGIPRTEPVQKGSDEKFCSECGAVIKGRAEICPKCGVRQALPMGTESGKPGERRCTNCGVQGPMKTWLRNYSGPQFLAAILLLLWVLPGVLFIAWGWGKYKCPRCGKVGENVPA